MEIELKQGIKRTRDFTEDLFAKESKCIKETYLPWQVRQLRQKLPDDILLRCIYPFLKKPFLKVRFSLQDACYFSRGVTPLQYQRDIDFKVVGMHFWWRLWDEAHNGKRSLYRTAGVGPLRLEIKHEYIEDTERLFDKIKRLDVSSFGLMKEEPYEAHHTTAAYELDIRSDKSIYGSLIRSGASFCEMGVLETCFPYVIVEQYVFVLSLKGDILVGWRGYPRVARNGIHQHVHFGYSNCQIIWLGITRDASFFTELILQNKLDDDSDTIQFLETVRKYFKPCLY